MNRNINVITDTYGYTTSSSLYMKIIVNVELATVVEGDFYFITYCTAV